MKKNEQFIDVSSWQNEDLSYLKSKFGTSNTIIKISEGLTYINPKHVGQARTTTPVGFYHFAWFGNRVKQAIDEANYFLKNIPQEFKHVPYLVLDFEDHAEGDCTKAVIAFMEKIQSAGYQPIYYSYKPFTLAHVNYYEIIERFPNSLWIAGYGTNDGSIQWDYFPSMEGIRWWQYTSTPLDRNVVLLDDMVKAKPAPSPKPSKSLSLEDMASGVSAGKYGNGAEREKKLGKYYKAVQAIVNERLLIIDYNTSHHLLAEEVMKGNLGNGEERKQLLGSYYQVVQKIINTEY